ncbi:17283_t:CDS:2 [Gigaspora margarita]|uniref:17283_t:CDS:1 n=1 Tax=Gigaspora margarita TaxID=4874 RepID=A0ABN7V2Y8_GIGMA|nr:17283_t:CDS:2 [Gigaspora margarita]
MVEEKHKAVKLACQTSNANAAKHYSLDLAILGRWVKKFSQDLSFFSQRNIHQNGLAVTYPSIKLKMAEILDKRSEDHLIYKSNEDSEEENSNENDEDSNEYEDKNSDKTGDEDSDENEYEDFDKNESEYSSKNDEESNKDNN